jgi:hypothetical protein
MLRAGERSQVEDRPSQNANCFEQPAFRWYGAARLQWSCHSSSVNVVLYPTPKLQSEVAPTTLRKPLGIIIFGELDVSQMLKLFTTPSSISSPTACDGR